MNVKLNETGTRLCSLELYNNPEFVEDIKIIDNNVKLKFDGQYFNIGQIPNKYNILFSNYAYKVKNWNIILEKNLNVFLLLDIKFEM